MEIIITLLMGFFVLFLMARFKDSPANSTEFKIYLKNSGYRIIDHHFTTNAFKVDDIYYNKEEYINFLKNKYNSDKVEVRNYIIRTSKTG